MDFKYESDRIYLNHSSGKLLAEITFPESSDGIVVINHTFVDNSLRGQGVAGKLVEEAAKSIKKAGKKAIPTCSYAVAWFQKHKEYDDILANK